MISKQILITLLLIAIVVSYLAFFQNTATTDKIADKIFYGGNIYTMENQSSVEAVAVKNDTIVFAGSEIEAMKYRNDNTEMVDLQGKTMMPGFIDPHIHHLSAIFFYINAVRADEPWPNAPGVQMVRALDRETFISEVKKIEAALTDPNDWLIVYGYANYYHGNFTQKDLDQFSTTRPVILMQRTCHEIIMNDLALAAMNFTAENTKNILDFDFANGHTIETATLEYVWPKIIPHILSGNKWREGLEMEVDYVHKNGVTTVGDLLAGDGFNAEQQKVFREIFDAKDISFRTYMIAEPRMVFEQKGADAAVKYIDDLTKNTGPNKNIIYTNQVKAFTDGAFFAQLMLMNYTDSHEGVWITPPDELEEIITTFWKKGYPLHIHVNGDIGLDFQLNLFEKLERDYPMPNNKVTFHHLGYARPDQIERLGKLNIMVSLLPYYSHALGDVYSTHGFGAERATHMSAAGSYVKEGMTLSIHSDYSVAPLSPLFSAWCAVNRIGVMSGNILAPEERLTVDQAMRAITIDAAKTINVENIIGSIKVGKKADFTILKENPYAIDPINLKDINITATIFNGRYFSVGN